MTEIHAGQIWRVVNRADRYVRVEYVIPAYDVVTIHAVVHQGPGGWSRAPGSTERIAKRDRFNGKHGGFVIHLDRH